MPRRPEPADRVWTRVQVHDAVGLEDGTVDINQTVEHVTVHPPGPMIVPQQVFERLLWLAGFRLEGGDGSEPEAGNHGG